MMKTLLILILSLIGPFTWAQEIHWELIGEVPVKGLEQISFDNRGQIFYSNSSGNLYQLSPDGKQINHYSPSRQASITQLEASWTVNIFTFSKDLQRYEIFDRFLNPILTRDMDRLGIGLAKAATLGNNNSLWVFDESNISLNRIDYKRQQLLQNQPLNLVLNGQDWNVLDIKEHRNMLYLRVQDEVLIFDNQGNYLRRLPVPGTSGLSIYGGHTYFIQENQLIELQLDSGLKKSFQLPKRGDDKQVLVHQNRLILYDQASISIYLNPLNY